MKSFRDILILLDDLSDEELETLNVDEFIHSNFNETLDFSFDA